jgi:hypothetical protein
MGLLHMGKAVAGARDEPDEDDEAVPTPPPPKPAAKIEIRPAGKPKS